MPRVSRSAGGLKVLTLNLWNREGPWAERAKLVRGWIERLNPDLIGFQEVLRGPDLDTARELLAGSDYHLDFAPAGPFWEDESIDFGSAIASRWPITDREALALPTGTYSDGCVALAVTTESPFGPIAFTTTHLMYPAFAGWVRELQVRALAELVLRRRPHGGFPPIVCGDFNARPDSNEIRFLTGLASIDGKSCYLLDAWEHAGAARAGETVCARNPYVAFPGKRDIRIDYVFVGPALRGTPGEIERCRVVCDEGEDDVFPSDHFGVFAELRSEG